MAHLTEIEIEILISAVSFFIGLAAGYVLWHKNNDRRMTSIQIASIAIFFGYLGFNFAVGREPSDLVSTAILSGIFGETIGMVIKDKLNK